MTRKRIFLLLIDILSLYLAIILAVLVRGFIHTRAVQTLGEWESAHYIIFLPSLFASLLFIYIAGLYDAKVLYDKSKSFVLLVYAQVSTAIFSVLFYYALHTELTPKLTLFLYIVFSISIISISRSLYLYFSGLVQREKGVFLSEEKSLITRLEVDYAPYDLLHVRWCDFNADRPKVVVFNDSEVDVERGIMLERLKSEGVQVYSYHQYYELVHKKVDLDNLNLIDTVQELSGKRESRGHYVFRRVIDIICGVIVFVPFVISLPFVMLGNIFFNKGKLFFVQDRVGYLGKQVWVYKLRTMVNSDSGGLYTTDENGKRKHALGNTATSFGMFLRKTRMDELPQCINLLKGNLSMIGPRADIIGFHRDLTENISNFKIKLLVPQGLTGWAQVHMSAQPKTLEDHIERFAYEVYYVKYRSVFIDIAIILKTIKVLISRTGA
jgi:lipopolysaccharide/colanic/teichoic acid biosynthesis glycosyltransferase